MRLWRRICLEKRSGMPWHRKSLLVDGINKTIIGSTRGSSAFLEHKGQRQWSLSAMALDPQVYIRVVVRTLPLLSPRGGPCFFWISLNLFLALTRAALGTQGPYPHTQSSDQIAFRFPRYFHLRVTLSVDTVCQRVGKQLAALLSATHNPSSHIPGPQRRLFLCPCSNQL